MTDPVPVSTVGAYQEWPVWGPLAAYFRCAWRHSMGGLPAARVIVIPDACLDLQWVSGELRIAGPDQAACIEFLPADAEVLGLRFHPGRAHLWLGMPSAELADRRVELAAVCSERARRIQSRLDDSPDLAAFVRAVESVTAGWDGTLPEAHDMLALYRCITSERCDGRPIMAWLGGELGQSERTLRRRFTDAFGYGPRTLQRIVRFQRFLTLRRQHPAAALAILAAGAGYADQAHLTRESRRLAGFAPSALAG